MPRGGFRPNAGRPPGSKELKKTKVVKLTEAPQPIGAVRAAMELSGLEDYTLDSKNRRVPRFRGNALDYLRSVYTDANRHIDLRLKAASVAIGYEVPKLQATMLTTRNLGSELPDDDLDRYIVATAREIQDLDGGEAPSGE